MCKSDTFRFKMYDFDINVSFQYYCFRNHDFYSMRKSDTFRFKMYDFVINVSFRYYCYRNDDVYKNTAQMCTYSNVVAALQACAVLIRHFNYGYMIMSKTCNSSIIAFGKRFCQQCVISVCIVFGMMLLSIMCHSCIYCFRNDAFVKKKHSCARTATQLQPYRLVLCHSCTLHSTNALCLE